MVMGSVEKVIDVFFWVGVCIVSQSLAFKWGFASGFKAELHCRTRCTFALLSAVAHWS